MSKGISEWLKAYFATRPCPKGTAVGLFSPMPEEPFLEGVEPLVTCTGLKAAYPYITNWEKGEMEYVEALRETEAFPEGWKRHPSIQLWEPADPLEEHRVSPDILCAVLVPGTAFSKTGVRKGHGKGFYDRYLKRIPPGCVKIGIATESQIVDVLQANPWDVPMDWVITNEKVYRRAA